jgi:hypothetical protein
LDNRLPAHLEASAFLRRAEVEGGFGTIIARGDRDRGAIVLLIMQRGAHAACLERGIEANGEYLWKTCGPPADSSAKTVSDWSQIRRKNDPDLWLIEVDVANAERFIAETTSIG